MHVELIKKFTMEAAHRVPLADGGGARLHGHSYIIEIVAEGEIDPLSGWLIDFGDIKKAFAPLYEQLDHHCLNDVPGLDDATCEGIGAWIYDRLKEPLPLLHAVRVSISGDNEFIPVELEADPVARLPRRIQFKFEAAQSLPHLPPKHPCRRLHGHTYVVEIGADNLERLSRRLKALYDMLDHRYLNEVQGLDEATSERLCYWIWSYLSETIDDLSVVVVQETATSRCIYRGK